LAKRAWREGEKGVRDIDDETVRLSQKERRRRLIAIQRHRYPRACAGTLHEHTSNKSGRGRPSGPSKRDAAEGRRADLQEAAA
jgi:hypothetical protein